MRRLSTTLAIMLGTLMLMMLITVEAEAKSIAKIRPIGGEGNEVNVDVWTDKAQGSVYNTGESVDVYFYANTDCYVTIYNIDTDGSVRILFPEYPDDGYVSGGVTYKLPDYYGHNRLRVTGPRGIEYLQAVATLTPGAFRYKPRMKRYHHGIDPVTGDPFEAMNSINRQLIAYNEISATSTTYFFVKSHVWYPRYMCNSCHGRNYAFDPYVDACTNYQIHVPDRYDYFWNYSYYPVSARFVFGGPFWRIELRTVRAHRYWNFGHYRFAHGHSNYYSRRPPHRPHKHIPLTTSRTMDRRKRSRAYKPHTFDTRSRRSTTSRSTATNSRNNTSSRDRSSTARNTTTRNSTRSRSVSTAPIYNNSRSRTSTTRTETRSNTASRSRTSSSVATPNRNSSTSTRSRTQSTSPSSSASRSRSATTTPVTRSTTETRSRTSSISTTPNRNSSTRSRSSQTTRSSLSTAPSKKLQSQSSRTRNSTSSINKRASSRDDISSGSSSRSSRTKNITTSRIPSASKKGVSQPQSASRSHSSSSSSSRSRQQSSSSSSPSRSRTRTR